VLTAPVRFTPTFVMVDNGREVGRITGYANDDTFWGLFGTLTAKLAAAPGAPDRI
jgi:thioredoxin-related protein